MAKTLRQESSSFEMYVMAHIAMSFASTAVAIRVAAEGCSRDKASVAVAGVAETEAELVVDKVVTVDSSSIPEAEHRTSSSDVCQRRGMVPGVAAGKLVVGAEPHNCLSVVRCRYNSSPCHPKNRPRELWVCSDTYSTAEVLHTDSRNRRWPYALPAFGRNTVPQSLACCAGPVVHRVSTSSHRMSARVWVVVGVCFRIIPESVAPSRSYRAADAADDPRV